MSCQVKKAPMRKLLDWTEGKVPRKRSHTDTRENIATHLYHEVCTNAGRCAVRLEGGHYALYRFLGLPKRSSGTTAAAGEALGTRGRSANLIQEGAES